MSSRWLSSASRRDPHVARYGASQSSSSLQGLGPQPVEPPLGVDPRRDQACLAEHPQVLGHGGLADPQEADQIMHGAFTFQEEIQNPPPVAVGECLEDHEV